MEMPTPGAEHQTLARLSGSWVGEETMLPSPWSPQSETRRGSLRSHMLDGFFLVTDYEQKSGDQVSFRGHGVFSWDPQEKHYVMYWFDSMGGAGGVATGHLQGNQLIFANTSPMGHHRYIYTLSDGGYEFEMAMSQDGK